MHAFYTGRALPHMRLPVIDRSHIIHTNASIGIQACILAIDVNTRLEADFQLL